MTTCGTLPQSYSGQLSCTPISTPCIVLTTFWVLCCQLCSLSVFFCGSFIKRQQYFKPWSVVIVWSVWSSLSIFKWHFFRDTRHSWINRQKSLPSCYQRKFSLSKQFNYSDECLSSRQRTPWKTHLIQSSLKSFNSHTIKFVLGG